jgi:hypothetical protein
MQPAVKLHSAYFPGIRSTGPEPRPRPGRGFKAITRQRARKKQGRGPANGATIVTKLFLHKSIDRKLCDRKQAYCAREVIR